MKLKKVLATITLVIVFIQYSSSQKQFNNWHFGAGINLNFNSSVPVVDTLSSIYTQEGSAAVSNCHGDLLFYTDGGTIWNSSGSIMENGTDLKGNPSSMPLNPSSQPVVIVKRPMTAETYYVFTVNENNGLHYSTVNMTLNGGLGEVVAKNILLSNKKTSKLAVSFHSNKRDIWVVTNHIGSNEYQAFLVTQARVHSFGVSSFDGPIHRDGHGDMKISPNGKKIASVIDFEGEVFLGDFDNSTGLVSNSLSLKGFSNPHGVEFSPDNTKMYVNSTFYGVIQFTIGGSNLLSLTDTIHIAAGEKGLYGGLQLGPDNKIYITDANSSYLSVIPNPDADKSTVRLNYNSLFVGGERLGYSLPNTLLTRESCENEESLSVDYLVIEHTFSSYPNPASTMINFKVHLQGESKQFIALTNLEGDEIFKQTWRNREGLFNGRILCSSFKRGIYFLTIKDGNLKTVKKIILQ